MRINIRRNGISSAFLSSTALVSILFATSTSVLAQQAATSSSAQPAAPSTQPAAPATQQASGSSRAGSQDVQVETVTVVARKVKEKLQDVPIPITTMSADEIQQKNITTFQQLELQLPALSYTTGNNKQTNIGIRGIGNNGSNQDGLDPSVGVLVDGVYQPRLGLITNEYVDLAEVEELRGPQGTLFGKNTTAGVILLNTQLPSFTRSSVGQIDIGEYGTRQYKVNTTGPINDQLAYRITGYDDRTDGFVTNVQDNNGYLQRNSVGGRGQLLWTPNADLSIRFIASGDHQDFRTGGSVFDGYYPLKSTAAGNAVALANANGIRYPTGYNTYLTSITQVQSTESSTEETSLHVDWTTPYGTLSDITAFNHWQFIPNNNGQQPFLAYSAFGTTNNLTNESEELRWTSPRGKQVEWQTGLYFYRMNLGATNNQILGPQYVLGDGGNSATAGITQAHANGLNTGYQYTIDDVSYAGYAAGTWHVTPQWDVNAGLRETLERKAWAYNGYVIANPGGATATEIATVASGLIQPGSASVADNSLGYQIGTSYHLTKDLLGYASFTKGDKSSGINQNPLSAGKIAAGASQILAPEHAFNFEAGLKSEWFNHRLVLNATAYREYVMNYQATGVYYIPGTATTQTYLTNVGAIESRGFEIGNKIVPFEGFSLYGDFAYTNAFYASYANASCPAFSAVQICNFNGRSVPFTPKFFASETAEYNYRLENGVVLYGLIDGNWRSGQYLTPTLDPYSYISGYFTGDLRAGVRFADNHADLSVWVTNFTNAYYFNALAGTTATGVVSGTPGQPRTFGITLRGIL